MSTPHILLAPLVGSQHRAPPAKQVLAVLPAGTFLTLTQVENPYDEFAIEVVVNASAIPSSHYEQLEDSLAGTGWILSQVFDAAPIPLGYVAASSGFPLRRAQESNPSLVGNQEFLKYSWETATFHLVFAPNGYPLIRATFSDQLQ